MFKIQILIKRSKTRKNLYSPRHCTCPHVSKTTSGIGEKLHALRSAPTRRQHSACTITRPHVRHMPLFKFGSMRLGPVLALGLGSWVGRSTWNFNGLKLNWIRYWIRITKLATSSESRATIRTNEPTKKSAASQPEFSIISDREKTGDILFGSNNPDHSNPSNSWQLIMSF